MKKILVPVDFSKCSEKALHMAAQIARKNGSDIILLHLIDLPSGEIGFMENGTPTGPAAILLMEDARKKFEELLGKDYLEGIKVQDFLDFNKPVEGIAEYAEKHGADLIVMGSHGIGKTAGFFVGSNTEKVVRSSKVPVFVVKKFVPEFNPELIIYASDFKENCHHCFRELLRFSRMFDADIHLLRINKPTKFLATYESEELIKDFMKKHTSDYPAEKMQPVVYDDYSVPEGIFHYAHEAGADMIALSTHGRQGLWHFLQDSIAEDVVNKSDINILTFRMEK